MESGTLDVKKLCIKLNLQNYVVLEIRKTVSFYKYARDELEIILAFPAFTYLCK
jgi:hypothetical protein